MWKKTALIIVVLLMILTFLDSGIFRGTSEWQYDTAFSGAGPQDGRDNGIGGHGYLQSQTSVSGTSGPDAAKKESLSNEAIAQDNGSPGTSASLTEDSESSSPAVTPGSSDASAADTDSAEYARGDDGDARGDDEYADGDYAAEEDSGPDVTEIVISAVGDCMLGGDLRAGSNGFMREYVRQEGDWTYFLRNVSPVFEADDLTIANMEGTFAAPGAHKDKEFVISGPPELVNVFTSSGVDVVSLANNHTMDYWQRGYDETVAVLADAGISYFGNEYTAIIDVKGVKVGLFGYSMQYITRTEKERIAAAIRRLREGGADIVIAYYHWGTEYERYPNATQREIARHTIDSGANLVLGSHPHILQGIEEYGGGVIAYSLGNFCFGGNNNPPDKDTIILQLTYVFSDGVLTGSSWTIIPCSISSVRDRNDYQPVLLEGDEAERVIGKIRQLSAGIG